MSAQDRVVQSLLPEVSFAVDQFWTSDLGKKCESEIERIFAATLFVSRHVSGIYKASSKRSTCLDDGAKLFLEPQYVIGDFRVDFLYGFSETSGDLFKCIAIECDGHDFHERTKEQAARDKSRDRYLSTQVGRVLRFTGSELYRDPYACVYEATKMLFVLNMGVEP